VALICSGDQRFSSCCWTQLRSHRSAGSLVVFGRRARLARAMPDQKTGGRLGS